MVSARKEVKAVREQVEKERIKQEAEQRHKEKIQNRGQVITSVPGVIYNGIIYTLGKFSIGQLDVETSAGRAGTEKHLIAEYNQHLITIRRNSLPVTETSLFL